MVFAVEEDWPFVMSLWKDNFLQQVVDCSVDCPLVGLTVFVFHPKPSVPSKLFGDWHIPPGEEPMMPTPDLITNLYFDQNQER